MPPNWVNYLVTTTLGTVAITIGYVVSIGPLYIMTQFNVSSAYVGSLFAISTLVSASYCIIMGNLSKAWQKRIDKVSLKAPYNYIFWYVGIGISSLGIAASGFTGCIIFFFLVVGFNDVASLKLNMFNGQICSIFAYKRICPLAQVTRRTLNTVTAISGPYLYELHPVLPFIVAGGI